MTYDDITWVPSSEYKRTGYGVVQVEDDDDDSYVKGCIDRLDEMRRQCEWSKSAFHRFEKWIFPVIKSMAQVDVIDQLISVQPMGLPNAEIFYQDLQERARTPRAADYQMPDILVDRTLARAWEERRNNDAADAVRFAIHNVNPCGEIGLVVR